MEQAAATPVNGESGQATTEGLPHLLDTFDAATLYRYVTVRQAEVLRKEYNTLLAEGPAKKRSPPPMPGDPEEILHAPAAPEIGLLDQHVEPELVDPGLCEQAIDAAHIAQLEAVTPLLPMPPNRNVKALLNSLPDLPIFDLPKKSDMTYLQLRTVADACWAQDMPPDSARTSRQRGKDEAVWVEQLATSFLQKVQRVKAEREGIPVSAER